MVTVLSERCDGSGVGYGSICPNVCVCVCEYVSIYPMRQINDDIDDPDGHLPATALCTSNKEGNYTDTSGGGSEVVAPVDCNESGEAEKRDEIDCLGR